MGRVLRNSTDRRMTLVIFICCLLLSTPCVFGADFTDTDNSNENSVDSASYKSVDPSPVSASLENSLVPANSKGSRYSFESLPDEMILEIAQFLESPYSYLPFLSKTIVHSK